jgi:hypothetical protein
LHFDESGIGPISTYPECVRVENNSAIVEINTKSLDLILESKIDNLFITDSSDLLFLISEELKIIIFNKNDNFESYSINIDGINYIV